MKALEHVWREPRPATGTVSPVTEKVMQAELAVGYRRGHRQLVTLAFLVVAAALVVGWLLLHRSSNGSPPAAASATAPAIVSQAQLRQLAATIGHPVYWAGPKAGYSYEVTATSGGRFYVRYLPDGVSAGDPRSSFLVVGTYPQSRSFADLKRVSKRNGSIAVGIDRGGLATFAAGRPTSVYFSYPGARYQVEVYSPSGSQARALVLGGEIVPVH